MSESKFDRGFTKVPNILLNSVMKGQFTAIQLKLIMVIWRYTSGFMRDSAELSISFLANEIGSSRTVVSRQIARLIKFGVVQVRYTNSSTKARSLMINNDIEKWSDEIKLGVDLEVNRGVAPEVNRGVDLEVNRGVDQEVNYVLTARSTNKDNINIILYKKIKERVTLTEKMDQAVIRWLEYKTERGETYAKIPLGALITAIKDHAKEYGEDEVIEVINDCIVSGYKNIIWEKLKMRKSKIRNEFAGDYIDDYNHKVLEKSSRGINYD